MQPREKIKQLNTWVSHQVTVADLETRTGPIVTLEPVSRTNNRFDLGGESSDSEEEEIDIDEEYFDSFDEELDLIPQGNKDPPSV